MFTVTVDRGGTVSGGLLSLIRDNQLRALRQITRVPKFGVAAEIAARNLGTYRSTGR